MTHSEKILQLMTDLGHRGIRPLTVAPPMYRVLWHLGIEVKPPHFAPFWRTAAATGLIFAIFIIAINWGVHLLLGQPQPWQYILIELAGVAFISAVVGIYAASSYRRQARELALPRWEDYPAT
jgi:hypothetical protein